jgi:VanZ family protein
LYRPILLAISPDPSGTLLAVDGVIIGRGFQVLLPAGTRNSRLTLGNSVHSNGGWNGSVFSFGLLPRPLTGPELKAYQDQWLKTHDLRFVPPTETIQLLHFDEKSGNLVRDFSGAANNMILPARPTALERSMLSDDPTRDTRSNSRIKDVTVTLFGFVPFGLLLAVLLSKRAWRTRHVVTAVILSGFIISLGIETAQAWMPTRSSSAVDLLLNTLGAALGAVGIRKR